MADDITDAHGITLNAIDSLPVKSGFRFKTNKKLFLKYVTRYAGETGTTAYLLNASKEEITSSAFVGEIATFPSTSLENGETYYLVVSSGGGARTRRLTYMGQSYPKIKTNITYTGAYDDGADTTLGFSISSITTEEDLTINYVKEESSGRIDLGRENIFNFFERKAEVKKPIIRKQPIEDEVKLPSGQTKVIVPNSSYNYSSTEKSKTTTTYTTLISVSHKSKTGKVIIQAHAPWLVSTANGDATFRLTQGGNLIEGTENFGQWSSGDGAVNFSVSGYYEPEKDKAITYALQWKMGEAGEPLAAGGIFGSYNILVQDII